MKTPTPTHTMIAFGLSFKIGGKKRNSKKASVENVSLDGFFSKSEKIVIAEDIFKGM